jgi:hypothetical protein
MTLLVPVAVSEEVLVVDEVIVVDALAVQISLSLCVSLSFALSLFRSCARVHVRSKASSLNSSGCDGGRRQEMPLNNTERREDLSTLNQSR